MIVIFMRLVVMKVIVESLMATIMTLKGLVMAMTLILDVEQVEKIYLSIYILEQHISFDSRYLPT